jgi:hypothetical protein
VHSHSHSHSVALLSVDAPAPFPRLAFFSCPQSLRLPATPINTSSFPQPPASPTLSVSSSLPSFLLFASLPCNHPRNPHTARPAKKKPRNCDPAAPEAGCIVSPNLDWVGAARRSLGHGSGGGWEWGGQERPEGSSKWWRGS